MASSAPNSQPQASKPVNTPAASSEPLNTDTTASNEADSYYSAALWTSTCQYLISTLEFTSLLPMIPKKARRNLWVSAPLSPPHTYLIRLLSAFSALQSTGFVKEFPIAIQRPVEQLMALEYEAGKTRHELTALHQQRLDHHTILQQKREQILADIAQYLQPFTDTMSLPSLRK